MLHEAQILSLDVSVKSTLPENNISTTEIPDTEAYSSQRFLYALYFFSTEVAVYCVKEIMCVLSNDIRPLTFCLYYFPNLIAQQPFATSGTFYITYRNLILKLILKKEKYTTFFIRKKLNNHLI